MRRRGSWRPARLTSGDTVSLASVLVGAAVLYSGDYVFGQDVYRGNLTVIETILPLWIWSVLLFAGAGTLAAGILFRIHAVVWAGHSALFVLYTTLTAGILGSSYRMGFDGIRSVGVVFFVALMHGLFALRGGPRPFESGEAAATDVVVSSAGDTTQGE